MLLIALAGLPGPTPSPLLLLAGAGAVSAVGWATLAVARSHARLRTELEEYKESQRPAPAAAPPGHPRRPSAPTFGALYQARPSPIAGLGEHPWTLPLVGGGACIMLTLLLGFSSRQAAPEVADPSREVAAVRNALDSVASRVKLLEDSLQRLRTVPVAAPARTTLAARTPRRSAEIPPVPVLPPAPTIRPAPATPSSITP